MIILSITAIIICYLIGSIPFGFILTKIFLKIDVRKIGSGNIGATNVLRTGNKKLGYLTLFFDISKAVIPIFYVKIYYPEFLYISSLSIFLGHVFPIWLKFKGGKGIASYVGILFCIDIFSGFLFCISWVLIFILKKYSSLSSIISSLIIPMYHYFYVENNYYFYFIMFILIIYTHRENIKRLRNNTESKSKIY